MSLFDSINETNRAYCLHHVKRSMFLYKSMNYTVKNELYRFFYGSYGFLWILFTILTGVVHSGLACMLPCLLHIYPLLVTHLPPACSPFAFRTVTRLCLVVYTFILWVTHLLHAWLHISLLPLPVYWYGGQFTSSEAFVDTI